MSNMHIKIVELSPIPYEGKSVSAMTLVGRDYESYDAAKLALLAYESEADYNRDWSIFAIVAMSHDFRL